MNDNSRPTLHPRNRHQGRYDFPRLIAASPELAEFVILNPYGKQSIDFANPDAVRVFNRALLKGFHGIEWWDIPPGYLCPPIPGRADYLHFLADLLAEDHAGEIPRGAKVRVLDIGTGANCIYPLIGNAEYGWRFVGTDIDTVALASAGAVLKANRLDKIIRLRRQTNAEHLFKGVMEEDEYFDVSLCNPPFHASPAEAVRGSQRKWRNLGKADPSRKLPVLNFGGQNNELWCEGGEVSFIKRMAAESAQVAQRTGWFSTLVSKAGNVAPLEAALSKAGVLEARVVQMGQGQKQSRFVAWSFLTSEQRQTQKNRAR